MFVRGASTTLRTKRPSPRSIGGPVRHDPKSRVGVSIMEGNYREFETFLGSTYAGSLVYSCCR